MKKHLIILTIFLAGTFSIPAQPLTNASAEDIISIVEEHKGKKPVLVNFWATWCAPCVEEFPYILELHKKYEGQFKLILVSGDFEEARDNALEFLKKQGVHFETYFKQGKDHDFITAISEKWTGALPFTIVYNKAGDVSASWEGKADFEKFESELLTVINED